ncbi:uncharacterized protein HKW66_Vig0119500 [Vigna angularis]|uniref:Uncharacterized protein n=1 Tax=Phaseolus angularis TaxID=3914 RepID=A0A8T0JW52_PHAAN|nr:uncharacterized protein HKW66_Vig0119500 [Vigna angularis]
MVNKTDGGKRVLEFEYILVQHKDAVSPVLWMPRVFVGVVREFGGRPMIDVVQRRVILSCSNSESLPGKASDWSPARVMSLLGSNFNLGKISFLMPFACQ